MRKTLVFLSFLALVVALPAGAQMQPKSLARIIIIKPKPSMDAQWAEGMKKLQEWAHQHNLPLANYTWRIISGPRTGDFAVGTFGHDWKDFDAAAKASQGVNKEIGMDLVPYTESIETSYWAYREDLSGHPENAGQAPPAYLAISTFFFKPGSNMGAVEDAIKEVAAAIQKTHWSGKPSQWYSLVNGGDVPALTIVTGHGSWADFQPPATSLIQMLTEVYGKEGTAALGKKFFGGMQSHLTAIWRYLPNSSHIPASQ